MSKVQIRVAREKKPQLTHRPFTEREKELNAMNRQDMLKEWRYKLDPYKLKAVKELEKGKPNPCHYMSLYRIEQIIKTMEACDNPPFKQENESIEFAIDMIVTFKDLMHITTSEAVAVYMIFKDKFEARIRETKTEPSDEEGAKIAYEAIQEFKADWNKAMANLEKLWKK